MAQSQIAVKKVVKCGVLHGSPLGLLLFLIYIIYLTHVLEKPIVHHFADNIFLVCGNNNLLLYLMPLIVNKISKTGPEQTNFPE